MRMVVSFYDLTKDNKLMPTNAQVSYRWLTSEAGWAEGVPRFLEATYVRPKTQTFSADGRRYGGFIVRVYFDGQLQDSRASSPESINALSGRGSAHVPSQCDPWTLTVATGTQICL